MIDIDGFKKVNDAHGHLAGDELLKQFATELRSAFRSTDVIARWGGDEFLVLMDCAEEEAGDRVERLRKWVCGDYTLQGRSGTIKLRLDASIGLAGHRSKEPLQTLVARADAAMYAGKAAGRSRAVSGTTAA
jgi:diguanylate cyclase (GGDEF)-like protein